MKKIWYRHTHTGDLAYLNEDGTKLIKDRPLERIEVPFNEEEWALDKDRRPLTKHQVARIAFEADAAMCAALNQREVNPGIWQNLKDKERIKWTEKGPAKGIRKRLYDFIIEALKPLGPGNGG